MAQHALKSALAERVEGNLNAFADCNLAGFRVPSIWEVLARALQGTETPLGVRSVKMGHRDHRVSSGLETIRMPATRAFGMLPIVQADGVAIATKLD